MKNHILLAVAALLVASCATSNLPSLSPDLVARGRADHSSAEQLASGRELFVTRCLECHTLPSVTKYTREEWSRLVREMAGRANLTAGEEQSVVAYLRAAASDTSPSP